MLKLSRLSLLPYPIFHLLIGFLVLVRASESLSLTGDLTKDPAKIVEKYLSLDKRGARLHADSFEVLVPFINWRKEPVWGRLVVISQYHVIEDVTQWQVLNSLETFIPVTFQVLGTVHLGTATFLPEPQTKLEHFHIKAVGDRWRILDPQLPPHVGVSRLIGHIRHLQLQESDESRRGALRQLQKDLEKAR